MIRVEVKITIPDNQSKQQILKMFLDHVSEDSDSFFWQTPFDVVEGERASLEAVLGQDGFSFLDGRKLLIFTFDLLNQKQAQKVYAFFQSLAVTCDLEINEYAGKRIYGELVDIDDLEESDSLD